MPNPPPVTLEERFQTAKVIFRKRGFLPGLLFWVLTYWLIVSMAYHQENLMWREYFAILFARVEPGGWHIAAVLVGAIVYSFYRFGRANWFDCFITTLASLVLYVGVVAIANRAEIYYSPGYRWETLSNFIFLNGYRHDISIWNFIGVLLTLSLLLVYAPARPWFFGLLDLPKVIRRPGGRIRMETVAKGIPPRR